MLTSIIKLEETIFEFWKLNLTKPPSSVSFINIDAGTTQMGKFSNRS